MGYNIPSKTIDELTYMDDVFLSTALEDNIPVVQRMVRIILDDESIVVTKETSQKELKNLFGRSIRCDAYSEDDKSRKYDIEIQNGSMVPAKVFHKLYVSDVKKEDIKTFSNTEEYIKSKERKTSKF